MGNTATAKKGNEQESGEYYPAVPVSHQMLVIVQLEVAYPLVNEEQPLAVVVQR
ncbi:hypothetical protein PAMA_001137 [Pampus argenteus]